MTQTHQDRAHAKLSASGSERWLHCTAAPTVEADYPDVDTEFSKEGTQAHELAHAWLEFALLGGDAAEALYSERLAAASTEMRDHVGDYVRYCLDEIEAARGVTPDARVLVEQRLDFSRWVPEGFGTGDLVIVTDSYLRVIDLKYGKGVQVFAEENSQEKLYGLGAVDELGFMYGFEDVILTVHQPRLDHVDTWKTNRAALLAWGESIKAIALEAYRGPGVFKPTEKGCRFCKARYECRARHEEAMRLTVEQFDIEVGPSRLTMREIGGVLAHAKKVEAWAKDVQHYARHQAARGHVIPGYKLVAGRAVRRFEDQLEAMERLTQAGHGSAVFKDPVPRGLAAVEKAIGKTTFSKLLGDLVVTSPAKPTLVPESDPREPIFIDPLHGFDFADDQEENESGEEAE